MKMTQVVALPLAAAIVSLVAAPSIGQAIKRPDSKSAMVQKRSTAIAQIKGQKRAANKQRSAADVDIRAFRSDGTRMTIGDEGAVAGAVFPTECFNSFVDGPIDGQNGWTTFLAAQFAPVISSAAPIEGTKSLLLADDPLVADGTVSGAFSPDTGAQPAGKYTGQVLVNISNIGGADYTVAFQAPSQSLLANRVIFEFTGNILILDDPGAGLAFIDSGTDWSPNVTHTLRIELDVNADTQEYYLDNALIYTGVAFGATSFEQAVMFSDSFHLPGEVGQMDCLEFDGVQNSCGGDISSTTAGVPDGVVDVSDLVFVITNWGGNASNPANISSLVPGVPDNVVDVSDLLYVITNWGPCTGACCNAGNCTQVTEAACLGSGGEYQGHGTSCATTVCPPPPGGNDSITGALDITANIDGAPVVDTNASATPAQHDGNPAGADPEIPAGSPSCQWNLTPTDVWGTVWYKFTAPAAPVRIGTCNSAAPFIDSILAVYSGTPGSLVEVACADDTAGCGPATSYYSSVDLGSLTPGSVYYVMVGCPGSWAGNVAGTITLNITTIAPPAGNDTCAGATVISLPFSESVNVSDYTPDMSPGSMSPCVAGSFTMDGSWWYTYTATSNATITVSTCGSPTQDTLVTAFNGSCGGLIVANCDDDTCVTPNFGGSTFSFAAISGLTYYFHFETYSGGITGPVSVSITSP